MGNEYNKLTFKHYSWIMHKAMAMAQSTHTLADEQKHIRNENESSSVFYDARDIVT